MRSQSFIERIIHNPLIQTLVIFISGGWIILEITEYFIENFGLNENARNILLIIFASIFPVALFLSWYLSRNKMDREKTGSGGHTNKPLTVPQSKYKRIILSLRKPKILFPGILIIVAIVLSVIFRIQHHSKTQFALDYSLPSLENDNL